MCGLKYPNVIGVFIIGDLHSIKSLFIPISFLHFSNINTISSSLKICIDFFHIFYFNVAMNSNSYHD